MQDLKFNFDEKPIIFSEISKHNPQGNYKEIVPSCIELWKKTEQGEGLNTVTVSKNSFFSKRKMSDTKVCNTLTAHCSVDCMHSTEKRCLNDDELKMIGSYPMDYIFNNIDSGYLIGMSVPPVMTAQIAHQIYLQWFSNLKKDD
jgi:DNA (cytosine-5)-methyltransferase 1